MSWFLPNLSGASADPPASSSGIGGDILGLIDTFLQRDLPIILRGGQPITPAAASKTTPALALQSNWTTILLIGGGVLLVGGAMIFFLRKK